MKIMDQSLHGQVVDQLIQFPCVDCQSVVIIEAIDLEQIEEENIWLWWINTLC